MYDYIIVGGGSAGCVLANRLSADGRYRVCLLEAGPRDTNPFIHVPAGIIPVIRSKTLNWHYWTAPDPGCDHRPLYWPRGRTLGGSSAINAMCYVRGNAWDYDHWAALGCTGWSYREVLPLFRRMEHFEPGADAYHGEGGPLNVAPARFMNPLMKAFVAAAQEAGHAPNDDFNGARQDGVGYYHVMQKNGERCSNARAYLRPAEERPNLTVLTGVHVTRVLFEGQRAVGVRYEQGGLYRDVFAQREVVLSAGAIGSPQLLLLSGVGPRAELEHHGIAPVKVLPGVGENLQDHLDIHITMLEKTRHAVSFHPRAWLRSLLDLLRYVFGRRGEFTSNYAQAGGFIKSDPAHDLKPVFRHFAFTLMTCFLRPESRGRIRLASTDPHTAPLIEPRYLSTERDMDALVQGFKQARKVLQQPALAPHTLREFEPGEAVQSDEDIRAYIRRRAETVYHPVGTCKMGVDAQAVVDPRLRVHGLRGLRVVDASIMPTLVGGNTNAPTTMIAEYAAQMMLEDAQQPQNQDLAEAA
jgi:choline dehydrogenase